MPPTPLGPLIATLYEIQSSFLEPRLKAEGVRWSTFQLLATVMAAGEEASQAEVARRLGLSPATLSESVGAHVKKGLIEQIAAKGDRRKRILALTPEAKRQMRAVAKHVQEFEQLLNRQLSESERSQTAHNLSKIIDNLSDIP